MADATLPLFYKKPRPLTAARDGDTSLRPGNTFHFAATTNSVPLLAAEFAHASRSYPIVFTLDAQPLPVALLGLRAGSNLFVDAEGNWEKGAYIPAYVRRYPFIFVENPDGSKFTLCIDEAAENVVAGRENPLFVNGEATEAVKAALKFVSDYQQQIGPTQEFAAAVAAAGLLDERRADITTTKGEKIALGGFRMIDEQKVGTMSDDQANEWRKRGWLGLVYAALVANAGWNELIGRLSDREG